MATAQKVAPQPHEARVALPPQLLKVFSKHPRILIKYRPDGLWPVDPGMLEQIDWGSLAKDRAFNRNFEVVIQPRS